jgi:hypothetical protein
MILVVSHWPAFFLNPGFLTSTKDTTHFLQTTIDFLPMENKQLTIHCMLSQFRPKRITNQACCQEAEEYPDEQGLPASE